MGGRQATQHRKFTPIVGALLGPALLIVAVTISIAPAAAPAGEPAQTEMLLPLTVDRWCPASPLLPQTGGPLSPIDMHAPLRGQEIFHRWAFRLARGISLQRH